MSGRRGLDFETCRTAAQTERFAERFAQRLSGGEVLSLEGTLGMGKTVFVRGLARALGHDPDTITSPSFVLAIEHPDGDVPLLHVDLYRLAEGSGLDDLGIEEAAAAGFVVAVEWGERMPPALRRAAWRIVLASGVEPGARAITIVPPTQGDTTRAGSSALPS